jgi:hypothetical protein
MKVQISLRAENLPSPKGWMLIKAKKPNMFAVVSNVTDVGSVMGIKRHRVGVTEVVNSTFSPQWATIIFVNHHPGFEHRIAVDIFHSNNNNSNNNTKEQFKLHEIFDLRYQGEGHRGIPKPKDATHVTSVLFCINQVFVDCPDWTTEQKIAPSGKVILHIETNNNDRDDRDDDTSRFRFHIRGYSFPSTRRNFLERPDFYFEIFRKFQMSWWLVYRSRVEKGMLNPYWQEDQIQLAVLCNNDFNRELLIQIVDMDGSHRHVLGSFETSVHGLMGAVSTNGNCDTAKAFDVMHGGKKLGKAIVLTAAVHTTGRVEEVSSAYMVDPPTATIIEPGSVELLPMPVIAVEIMPAPTVLARTPSTYPDYARNCPIDWCLAIDFTDANGDFRSADSAHYRCEGGRLNDYEWTMSVVGETLRDLNPKHDYPIWGFGGCFQNKTHSIFQCGSSPTANGVSGLLQAYATTFKTGLTLGKQRKLDNVLMAAAHHAKKQLDEARRKRALSYTVLTILMVGTEVDVLAVKDKIRSIRGAPLSIIIIRMGSTSRLDDAKLRVYLADGGRQNCTLLDSSKVRDATALSAKVTKVLQEQMPAYFQCQGIAP